jgi:hypothetical protein
MLKMIDDLYKTGLWGESHEDVVRRLVEVQLRELRASTKGTREGRA